MERQVREPPVRYLNGSAAIPLGLWWTLDLEKREVEFFAGHLPEELQLRECQKRLLGMVEQYLQETSFREGFAEYVTKKLRLVVVPPKPEPDLSDDRRVDRAYDSMEDW